MFRIESNLLNCSYILQKCQAEMNAALAPRISFQNEKKTKERRMKPYQAFSRKFTFTVVFRTIALVECF